MSLRHRLMNPVTIFGVAMLALGGAVLALGVLLVVVGLANSIVGILLSSAVILIFSGSASLICAVMLQARAKSGQVT